MIGVNLIGIQYFNQQLFCNIYISEIMSLRRAKQLLEKKRQMEGHKVVEEEPEEEEVTSKTKKNHNLFSMLGGDEESEEEQPIAKEEQIEFDQQVEKKKNKKNKNKNKNKKNKEEEQIIQLQKTMKQLGIEVEKAEDKKQDTQQWMNILIINEAKFNYEKELRRHFRGWETTKEEGDPQLNKKQQQIQKHLKKMMKKSVLSPGINQYFPIREKFQIARQDYSVKFLPSKKYEQLQKQYEVIRNSNDINALYNFSQKNPEHVDSLYGVGQFLRLQGNYREADKLIQRVIYIYEMAGGYELGEFIKQDFSKKYLVYDNNSTSFFMAIFKLIDILGKKGCFKSALEYNKFLLKVNTNDPTACLLCMDFNAISGKQYNFVVNFIKHFSQYLGQKDKSIYLFPNYTYSFALAKFMAFNQQKKQSQLLVEKAKIEELLDFKDQHWKKALVLPQNNSFIEEDPRVLILRAIMVYPKLIIDIALKNEFSKQFLNHPIFQGQQKKTYSQIINHQFWTMVPTSYSYHFLRLESVEDSKGLDKILDVYVERSKILWKSNDVMLWVKGALGFVLNKIDDKFNYEQFLEGLCMQQYLTLQIPFHLRRYAGVNRHNFSDRVERVDLNNIHDNQQVQAPPQGNPINMNQNGLQLFLNSFLPWVNLPNPDHHYLDPDMPFIHEDQY